MSAQDTNETEGWHLLGGFIERDQYENEIVALKWHVIYTANT